MKNKITDEQIIQSACRQRQSVENRMDVEQWSPCLRQRRGLTAITAIAASIVSFIVGYGIHASISRQEPQPLAQTIKVQHDTITQIETIRDTVYQTRTITKIVNQKGTKPLIAQSSPQPQEPSPVSVSSDEMMACSMLCDDIPYELLARP